MLPWAPLFTCPRNLSFGCTGIHMEIMLCPKTAKPPSIKLLLINALPVINMWKCPHSGKRIDTSCVSPTLHKHLKTCCFLYSSQHNFLYYPHINRWWNWDLGKLGWGKTKVKTWETQFLDSIFSHLLSCESPCGLSIKIVELGPPHVLGGFTKRGKQQILRCNSNLTIST